MGRHWMHRGLRGVASVVAFVAITFVMMELGYRVYRDGFLGAFQRLRHGVPYSNLGTSNWIVFDGELGYRLNPERPTVNSFSIRSPPIAIPKPEGVFRIVVLGDSIPWDSPSFADLIELERVPTLAVELINASVPGYTAYQELLFFERYVRRVEPDLVIWAYCLNDNHSFLHRFDEEARMLLTDEARRSLRVDSPWEGWSSRSYVLTSIRAIVSSPAWESGSEDTRFEWESDAGFNTAWKDDSWDGYGSHLRTLKELTDQDGAELAIVVFPIESQLESWADEESRDYVAKPQRILAGLCDEHGIPCLDLLDVFLGEHRRGAQLFRDGLHLTDAGHALTARELRRFLEERELVGRARPVGSS